MSKTAGTFVGKMIEKFNGRSPLVPQILIGLGSIILRPLTILMNKKEDSDKRVSAASRIFATEMIAMPVAVGIAALSGRFGQALYRNKGNENGMKAIFETAGFMAANLIIPSIATFSLHKFPVKEKLSALILNKKDSVPSAPAKVGFSSLKNTPVLKTNIYNKTPLFRTYPDFVHHSEKLKV